MGQNFPIDKDLIFDRDGTYLRVGGDLDLLKELCLLFFSGNQKQIEELGNAIKLQKFERVKEIAHSIKSALGNLGAIKAAKLAEKLENASKTEDFSNFPELFSKFIEEIELFRQECLKEKLL